MRSANANGPANWIGPSPGTALPRNGMAKLSAERISSALLIMTVLLCNVWDAPRIIDGTIDIKGIASADSGDMLRQLAFLLLFCGAVALRFLGRGVRFQTIVPAIFVPILTWCWISVFWADDPEVALRRIAFTTIVIFTIALCLENLSYSGIVRSLLWAFGIVLIVDWVAVATFPHAVHGPGEVDKALIGNWRGIHNGKNEAGAFCALATILFLHEAIIRRAHFIAGGMAVLAATFLYQTQSKTSLALVGAAVFISICVCLCYRSRLLRRLTPILVCGIVLPIFLILFDVFDEAFTALLADPASLTGRADIWALLGEYWEAHPLLGSGFGSFWGVASKSAIRGSNLNWIAEIYTAHNGYLDLLVQIGAIGLILAFTFLVLAPFKRLYSSPLHFNVSRLLLSSVLIFAWLRDMFESSLLDRANPTWTVMVIMYCVLYRYSNPEISRSAGNEHPVRSSTRQR